MNIGQIRRERRYFPSGPDRQWGEWDEVASYIEPYPDADYEHAPDDALDALRDIRFAVRLHWGIYSLFDDFTRESWPFLKLTPEAKQEYNEAYRRFNPTGFDAAEWATLFRDAGAQLMAFTAKHHDGFSLFHTATRVRRRAVWAGAEGKAPYLEPCDLAYSVAETPFGRDVVRELTDACRAQGLAIDLYFSHPDWYDADFRPFMFHPMWTPDAPDLVLPCELERQRAEHGGVPALFPAADAAARARMMARHRAQLLELVTAYGPIDLLCLDMWLGHQVWPQLRDTIKAVRRASPRTLLRARGIGNYGDYHTPEGFVPGAKANTAMPWMCIYPLGDTFCYEKRAAYHKGAGWMLDGIVDCAAKGGTFMVGIGPDGQGRFHPEARRQLLQVGAWLARHGEGIYGTVPVEGDGWREGENIRYTRSKDGRATYVHVLRDPGERLLLRRHRPTPGAAAHLVGTERRLDWRFDEPDYLRLDLGAAWNGEPLVVRFA